MICEALLELEQIRVLPADPKFWRKHDLARELCSEFNGYLQKGESALGWSELERESLLELSPSLSSFVRLQTILKAVLKHVHA